MGCISLDFSLVERKTRCIMISCKLFSTASLVFPIFSEAARFCDIVGDRDLCHGPQFDAVSFSNGELIAS
jgi:hypothetical protein